MLMPFLIVLMTAVVMPITIVAMILRHLENRRSNNALSPQEEAGGITMSELQAKIEESVQNAVLPLVQQVRTLDNEVTALRRSLPEQSVDGLRRIGSDLENDLSGEESTALKTLGRKPSDQIDG